MDNLFSFIGEPEKLRRRMACLLLPLLCVMMLGKLTDTTGSGEVNSIFLPVMIAYLILLPIAGRGCLDSFYPGLMGWALTLGAATELVVYLRSAYRPNSLGALRETALLLLFFYAIKAALTGAAVSDSRRLRRIFFMSMTLLAALWAGAGALRCWRAYLQLDALGITELSSFKQYFAYGNWPAQAFLLLPYPLTLALTWREHKRWRVFSALTVLLLLAVFLFSFSRGAYIALAAFILLTATGCLVLKIIAPGRLVIYGAITVALLLLAAAPVRNSVMITASMLATPSQHRSLSSRGQLYRQSLTGIAAAPLFGIGTYNYPLRAMSGDEPAANAGKMTSREFVNTPLNRFISLLVEKGVAGFIVHLGILAVFFGLTLRRLARTDKTETPRRAALLLLATAMLSSLLYQMSYYPARGWEGVTLLEWTACAIIAALTTPEDSTIYGSTDAHR